MRECGGHQPDSGKETLLEQQIELEASVREQRGKGPARRLRKQGQVPAILYGLSKESVALTLDTKAMTRILESPAGHNQIVNLKVPGGEPAAAMAVDWQVDPVRGSLLHVDMQRVDLKRKLHLSVPIETVGVSVGAKEEGGIESIVTREVEIECLPLDVPARIAVDVSSLSIGDSVRMRDLTAAEEYSFVTNPDVVLVHVIAPKAVEEEVKPEEEVAAEGEAAEEAQGEEQQTEKQEEKE